MIVCIAEKPSVARDIARILGADRKMEGYMEGGGYQVTWTFGHLCELKEPHDYTPMWKTWSLSQLPMIPPRFGIKLINEAHITKQFAVIERLMQAADSIVNCGDAGQEGELIQRWVMQKAGAHCPVRRLWISSMTDEAIREGFAHLKDQDEYQSLYMAGLSRAIGDWLLGMNATRLYTLKYGQNRQVLSIGRVQTPTLARLVKRQHEIDTFTPEPYWVLATVYRDTTFTATKDRAAKDEDKAGAGLKKFTSKEEGEQAFKDIEGKPFTVTRVEKKEGKEQPPQLYDLTSLQVDCNRKFGFSAEMTLGLIQSLYEKKFTTYPRVDTQYLSDDIYPKCPPIMNGLFQGLNDAEQRVFDLVARRFIGVFLPDCTFSTTTVLGQVDQVEFKATGKEILDPGWRVTRLATPDPAENTEGPEGAESAEKEEKVLPTFVKGESGPHQPTLTEKWTTPPPFYTEATLLRAMETAGRFVEDETLRAAMKENGIGRPSSRAGIIETLFKRHYIRRERKRLVATPTGIELIGLIREELLKSCELTGIWEKKLRDIEAHKYEPQQFIDELKQMVTDIVLSVLQDNAPRQITVATPPAQAPAKKKI